MFEKADEIITKVAKKLGYDDKNDLGKDMVKIAAIAIIPGGIGFIAGKKAGKIIVQNVQVYLTEAKQD
jgi:hypothetical protein